MLPGDGQKVGYTLYRSPLGDHSSNSYSTLEWPRHEEMQRWRLSWKVLFGTFFGFAPNQPAATPTAPKVDNWTNDIFFSMHSFICPMLPLHSNNSSHLCTSGLHLPFERIKYRFITAFAAAFRLNESHCMFVIYVFAFPLLLLCTIAKSTAYTVLVL